MRRMSLVLALTVAVAAVAPGRGAPPRTPKTAAKSTEDRQIEAVVRAGDRFAMDLYVRLAAGDKGNLFFSPASIHTALAMTYAGARGKTARQMRQVLHLSMKDQIVHPAFAALLRRLNSPRLDRRKRPAYQLSVANAMWGQKGYPLRDPFTALVKTHYGAAMNEVDFARSEAARKTINDWVAGRTRDRIKDLIPQGVLTPVTRLVLTNAIYFKSNWAMKFQKRLTENREFFLSREKSVPTAMMRQQKRLAYLETPAFQAVELPYKRRDLSMVVLLPREIDGLAALDKSLSAGKLRGWLARMRPARVRVELPKFKYTSRFGLKKILLAMGMTDAFSPRKADFTGMSIRGGLVISDVLHKAFVAVDEEGTEAAAATAVAIRLLGMPRPQQAKIFRADHPFLFVIRHRTTGSILFLGRVANPAPASSAAAK